MRSSLYLPGGAGGAIFQHDALCQQFVADAVGFFEVFGFAGGGAGGDEGFNTPSEVGFDVRTCFISDDKNSRFIERNYKTTRRQSVQYRFGLNRKAIAMK